MLASKMQIAAKRWLDLVMLLPASLYLVADGGGETGRRRGRKRPLFANYLYSCFVPFRHSQRLVRYYDKVQAEVTSAGRHIIYVISVLNYLHRKYGRLTSASTATVGDVLSPSLGQFWRWAQRFPNCLSYFFLSFRFYFFGLLIFLGFLCYCCRFRLEISHLRLQSPPSDATNDMLKWPKRFILRILFRLFFSASPFSFFHSYITFVCLAACFVSLFAAAAIAIFWFRAFPAFGICFNCFPVLLLVIELFACMHPSPWSLWDMFQGWGWERSLNICTIFGSWHLHVGSQRRVLCISFVHLQAKVFKWFSYNLCRLQLRQPMQGGWYNCSNFKHNKRVK